MLQKINRKLKGQSTAEYAILIGLVIAAAVAMQIYVKRALQARTHAVSQVLVDQTDDLGTTQQYEPYYLRSNFEVTRTGTTDQQMYENGELISVQADQVQRLGGGQQTYEDVQQE